MTCHPNALLEAEMCFFMNRNKFHDFELNNEKVVFREIYGSDLDNIEQPISSVEIEPTFPQNVSQQEMNVQPVRTTYEETFILQVDNLRSKRHRNQLQRFQMNPNQLLKP